MLDCQTCSTPCFDFENIGICPIEAADWPQVPCCPDENESPQVKPEIHS